MVHFSQEMNLSLHVGHAVLPVEVGVQGELPLPQLHIGPHPPALQALGCVQEQQRPGPARHQQLIINIIDVI